mgnify:CR=1 FL=1
MKIHGTAKGGAVGKKDFGVAFGGGAVEPINDENLAAYYKFNETSGNILNSSESDESVGSAAAFEVTGASYNVGESPLGYAMTFDGTNDVIKVATSKSIFNFMHNTSAVFTVCLWLKITSGSDKFILVDDENGTGFKLGSNSSGNLRFYTYNGTSDEVAGTLSDNDAFPDTTNYYFYVLTYDESLASDNANLYRNASLIHTQSKTGDAADNSNSANTMQMGKQPGVGNYTAMGVSELSIWNKILSSDEIDALYNSGNGRAIY